MTVSPRIMPMPVPFPVYGPEGGFPRALRACFRNGKVRTYRLDDIQQPSPHLFSRDEFDRLYEENGGYKPKHAQK